MISRTQSSIALGLGLTLTLASLQAQDRPQTRDDLARYHARLSQQLASDQEKSIFDFNRLVDILANTQVCQDAIPSSYDVDGDHRFSQVDEAASVAAQAYFDMLVTLGWFEAHLPPVGWNSGAPMFTELFADDAADEMGKRLAPIGKFIDRRWFTNRANSGLWLTDANAVSWLDLQNLPQTLAVKEEDSEGGLLAAATLVDDHVADFNDVLASHAKDSRTGAYRSLQEQQQRLVQFADHGELLLLSKWLLAADRLPWLVQRWSRFADHLYVVSGVLPSSFKNPKLPRSVDELAGFFEDYTDNLKQMVQGLAWQGKEELQSEYRSLADWLAQQQRFAEGVAAVYRERQDSFDFTSDRVQAVAKLLQVGEISGIQIVPRIASDSPFSAQLLALRENDVAALQTVLVQDPYFSDFRLDDLNGDCDVDDDDVALRSELFGLVDHLCAQVHAIPDGGVVADPNHPYRLLCGNWPRLPKREEPLPVAIHTGASAVPPLLQLGRSVDERAAKTAAGFSRGPNAWRIPASVMEPLTREILAELPPPSTPSEFEGELRRRINQLLSDSLQEGEEEEADGSNGGLNEVEKALLAGSGLVETTIAAVVKAYSDRGWQSITGGEAMDKEARALADASKKAEAAKSSGASDIQLLKNYATAKAVERSFEELIQAPYVFALEKRLTKLAPKARTSDEWRGIFDHQRDVMATWPKDGRGKRLGKNDSTVVEWKRDYLTPALERVAEYERENSLKAMYLKEVGYTEEVHKFYFVVDLLLTSGRGFLLLNQYRDDVVDAKDQDILENKKALLAL